MKILREMNMVVFVIGLILGSAMTYASIFYEKELHWILKFTGSDVRSGWGEKLTDLEHPHRDDCLPNRADLRQPRNDLPAPARPMYGT